MNSMPIVLPESRGFEDNSKRITHPSKRYRLYTGRPRSSLIFTRQLISSALGNFDAVISHHVHARHAGRRGLHITRVPGVQASQRNERKPRRAWPGQGSGLAARTHCPSTGLLRPICDLTNQTRIHHSSGYSAVRLLLQGFDVGALTDTTTRSSALV